MASYRYERDITPEDLIQETPPPLTPAQQRANWWHYHWYYVVLIAAALLAVGYFVWSRVTEVQPDYTVAVVSRTDPQEGDRVSVADFAVPLEDTALAGTQSESGAEWYVARRLSEGVDADMLAVGDALWERLM